MRHPVRLALVACLSLAGSIADAAPKHAKRPAPRSTLERVALLARAEAEDSDEPAVEETEETVVDEGEHDEAPVKPRTHAPPQGKPWRVAIGPNVWASSVDAKVTVGSKTVSAGIGFLDLQHHARYGIPLLVDVQYGRFSFVVDLMYGVIDVAGGKDVGPFMVKVDGSASSLNVDGLGGVRLVGDEESRLVLEVRGGIRYQRTAIKAAATLDGAPVTTYETVTAGRDAVAGARVLVRPHRRFTIAGTVDMGVFGTSDRTWSAAADASVLITSHVLVSLGYRTLTSESAMVDLVMRGPRAAIQVVF